MDITINLVALSVNNLQESINWYTKILGFTLVDEYQNAEMQIARIQLGSAIFELIQVKTNQQPLPDYRKVLISDLQVTGTKHVCLQVQNLDTILPLLQANKIELVGQPDTTYYGGKYIFFKDCNGILIELYQA